MKTYNELIEAVSNVPVKLKQGNVQLVTPIDIIYDDSWKEYKIKLPNGEFFGWLKGKQLTVKNGKAVGVEAAIATKFSLPTIGDIQPKTQKQLDKELTALKRAETEAIHAKETAAISVFIMQCQFMMSKVPREKRDECGKELNAILSLEKSAIERVEMCKSVFKKYEKI